MNTQLKIKNKLKENFNVSELILIDESYKHKNHKKDTSGGHFKLLIVSNDFKDLSLIKRHQSIYKVLDKMIKVEIHALSIKAVTIQEHNN
tara:strand:- start:2315 stop:2584 length:270 start_codon:yes stop_codon:yes gene_type:complete